MEKGISLNFPLKERFFKIQAVEKKKLNVDKLLINFNGNLLQRFIPAFLKCYPLVYPKYLLQIFFPY
ncbi:MAG: hypothetical protein A3J65_03665 [Candidatus Buchananbacteria bacterium RIFCSPHIGHO2_02_FULL_45_11b]|uniref:Uncharacterized protein n=4 Tax=Candidatus Buchananiibacteriota TaxID=1817903 RepID=A0A1G1YNT5_9BACT|nr:MAG: hypothetical protein A2663_03405 [Candidatus Buchananbacteria bacterium RIFCSPHIGHO2_01_FULL_46_12]OGY50763.1 MAG: hypothetical protein A3J65_03665 [Candidatus Buchananbacteria bacterium RIFCSPHIGHO2_02_FULL_45_11b]OGY53310.1 MAG: hypothetical protein A3B15_03220 [Candidatus Buchananbacteria bacterium RIFCSPLOWO2_01_FULL_45_31]OGY55756.1 MAG: hypothetical protein A3H67_02560 [Candidatus Buchananbacteria bacterium RIFCSPLOWO2_02_FULL_46_11b]